MRRNHQHTRPFLVWRGPFGTLVRRIATHGWIISAALLVIPPCVAQPPGIVYSTTVPYTGMPGGDYPLFPIPAVLQLVADASGNTYIAGAVGSSGLPTTPGVYQSQYAGGTCGYGVGFSAPCPSAFIAKFNSNGTLLFLTYLGGEYSTIPFGLAVDESGDIYVGLQSGVPYVAKLSADGTGLSWVTFLTGVGLQQLTIAPEQQLAIGPDGSLYCLTGTALTKLNQSGQIVATVTLPVQSQGLAVGPDGSVYIGGLNDNTSITATPGAWQTTSSSSQGVAAKMSPSLSGFAWLTFVPGAVSLMQVAPDGTLWVSGTTSASNFPVLPGALQQQLSAGATSSGYLVHLSADGSKALASTYLAAPLTSLALDGSGNVIFSAASFQFINLQYVNFQATPGSQWPCQQPFPESGAGGDVGFFGKIDPAGQHLLWGTFSGPSVPAGPVTVDANGNAIAAGNVPNQGDITLIALTTVQGPPRLVGTCIAQSGSPNTSGPLAPGEIVSIYGAGFGPAQGVAAQASGNTIGTQLGGVQVLIEDTPVPLLYVSSTQINLVAPYLLNGRSAAHIKIVTADATSNEVVLGVQPSAPEIFLNAAVSGENPTAAILNQDGTVNSSNNPAHIGDTVAMFVSGVGQTTPPGVDGEIPQAAGGTPVLPIMVQVYTAGVGPYANVTYAGNAPGLVSGLTQVNFQMPSVNLVGAGPLYQAQIILYVGANSSNPAGPAIWFE
jgi:uncharacterized protein (TIGR03437 family)